MAALAIEPWNHQYTDTEPLPKNKPGNWVKLSAPNLKGRDSVALAMREEAPHHIKDIKQLFL